MNDLSLPERAKELLKELFMEDDWSLLGLAEFLREHLTRADTEDLIYFLTRDKIWGD